MRALAFVLAVVAGAGVSVQSGMNAQLASWLGSPFRAAIVNFVVGLSLLLVVAAAFARGLPAGDRVAGAPWWAWLGGIFGALFVATAAVAAPRLGAGTFIAAVVGGQTVFALALDRLGLVGFAQHALTPLRVAGALLLVVGVALVRYG